jgi:HD-like signal output (HDOD) protein/DNA-binding CsgD family transcriptional regulator
MAFAELEQLPALSESRERIIALSDEPNVATGELVATVESDPALAMAVLRAANSGALTDQRVDTAQAAVERIGPAAVRELAVGLKSFDFFERAGSWDLAPHKFRLHGLATRQAAERIAAEIFHPHRGRLALASLVHDIGKLVLIRAYPGYPAQVHRGTALPEERVHRERRELGVDHALVGGVLLLRWGLPASITAAVEHHHDAEAEGDAAVLRIADMLAHYQRGDSISPAALLRSAGALGLGPKELRRLMCDLAIRPSERHRQVDPCPLSSRELLVLQRLSEGSVYKEIALELELSASTVRSHLNKIYRKLGARDRAQAVLIASRRGWL